jgi:hypothetical protein
MNPLFAYLLDEVPNPLALAVELDAWHRYVAAIQDQAESRRLRRLWKYTRYRRSLKGQERTIRYNGSPAHREAYVRYRLRHYHEVQERRLDARIAKERAMWGPDLPTAAERMIASLGLSPWLLRDEAAWNRAHARVGKEFSCEHVRAFWTKKHQRFEVRRQSPQ